MIRSFSPPEKCWAGGLSLVTVPLCSLSEVASAAPSVPHRPRDGEVTRVCGPTGWLSGMEPAVPPAQTPSFTFSPSSYFGQNPPKLQPTSAFPGDVVQPPPQSKATKRPLFKPKGKGAASPHCTVASGTAGGCSPAPSDLGKAFPCGLGGIPS